MGVSILSNLPVKKKLVSPKIKATIGELKAAAAVKNIVADKCAMELCATLHDDIFHYGINDDDREFMLMLLKRYGNQVINPQMHIDSLYVAPIPENKGISSIHFHIDRVGEIQKDYSRVTGNVFINKAIHFFGFDFRKRTRKKEFAEARALTMCAMRTRTRTTLVEIGRLMGGYDHSTITHNIQAMEQKIEIDNDLKVKYEKLVAI